MKKQFLTSTVLLASLLIGACQLSVSEKKVDDTVASKSSIVAGTSSVTNGTSSTTNQSSSGMKMSSGMYMSSGSHQDPFMTNTFPKLDSKCQELFKAANPTSGMGDEAKMQEFIKMCADQVAMIEMPKTLDATCQSLYKNAYAKMKTAMSLGCDQMVEPNQACMDAGMAMEKASTDFHAKCETQAPGLKFPWENDNKEGLTKECSDARMMLMQTGMAYNDCKSISNKDCSMFEAELNKLVLAEEQICGENSISMNKVQ